MADEGDERFISARSAAIAPLLDVLSRHIAERQALGGLPADLHPPSAAGALLAMIDRLAVTPNLVRHDVKLETVSRAAAYFLSVLMHGYPL